MTSWRLPDSAQGGPAVFVCPDCGRPSTHPEDVKARYCGACHWWTGDPVMAAIRRDAGDDDAGMIVWLQSRALSDQRARQVVDLMDDRTSTECRPSGDLLR